jgi:hypothetical protein
VIAARLIVIIDLEKYRVAVDLERAKVMLTAIFAALRASLRAASLSSAFFSAAATVSPATQGALAWELRTSINLAQLRRDQNEGSAGRMNPAKRQPSGNLGDLWVIARENFEF